MNRKSISVLGGGSWGTVLAHLASLNGNKVTLWMRDEETAKEINQTHINHRYLPALNLGSNIVATPHIEEVSDSDTIICLLYTSPSPRDLDLSRMPSSA